MLAVPVEMPNDAWIAEQLKDLASLIRQDERRAAILLRKIFGKIHAYPGAPAWQGTRLCLPPLADQWLGSTAGRPR